MIRSVKKERQEKRNIFACERKKCRAMEALLSINAIISRPYDLLGKKFSFKLLLVFVIGVKHNHTSASNSQASVFQSSLIDHSRFTYNYVLVHK